MSAIFTRTLPHLVTKPAFPSDCIHLDRSHGCTFQVTMPTKVPSTPYYLPPITTSQHDTFSCPACPLVCPQFIKAIEGKEVS